MIKIFRTWISKILLLLNSTKNDGRSFLIYKSLLFSLLAQAGNLIIGLLLVPVTLGYLDSNRYGVWLTLISVISWVYLLDVGLGNGLRNKLTESIATNNITNAKGYIATTYFFLGLISLMILLILLPVSYFIDWNSFLNVKISDKNELLYSVLILILFYSFHFFLKLIGTIYMALQKPFVSQYLALAINTVNLFCILLIKIFYSPSLKPIAILLGGSQLLVYALFTIYSFLGPLKVYCPKWNLIRKEYIRPLFSMGFKFFIIQVSGVIMFTTSNIIISKFSEPSFVVEYNLANKYISTTNFMFAFILIPYWSAFTDAFARKEYSWIDSNVKKLLRLWIYTACFIVFMIFASPILYKLWVGDKVAISFSVTLFTGVFIIAMNASSIYNSLLNGIGKVNFNFILAIVQLIFFYPLILGFQFFINKITLSILSVMILNMVISTILLRIQYKKIRKSIYE